MATRSTSSSPAESQAGSRAGSTSGPTALAPEVQAQMEATIEHYNGHHADTVLLLTRHCGDAPDATDAEALDVDTEGVDVRATVDGERRPARIPFPAPATTAAEVQSLVLALIATARQAVGESEPLTSLERELRTTAGLPTRLTSVAEVSELSPNLRRIVLRGGLDDYRPLGGDDFAFLFVPRHADDPNLVDGFTMADWQGLPEDERPFGAYYTIRRFDADDPAGPSVELWAVLHGHHDGVGGWAAAAEPGATVALWGPRRSYQPPEEGAGHHLFVADESGLAAVAALLDRLVPGPRATVVAETVDTGHQLPLTDRPNTDIRWLHRGDTAPGESAGFLDTVRNLDLDPADTIAFGAGESRQITAARRYLRHELALPADRVFLTGYWRR